MTEAAIITRDDAKLAVSFTPQAVQLRDSALEVAALVGKVTNSSEQEDAVRAQTELQRILQLAEKARKAAKEPVLTFGRRIDDAAKEFIAELNSEMTRVSGLVASFQHLEQARLRAAENARLAEISKLEKEKHEALAKATSHDQMDAIQEHFNNRAAVEAAPPAPPPRAENQVVKSDWEVIITNPYDLAKYHPNCVTIEPKLSEIKQLLNNGVTVAGVKAEKVTKASVRIGRQPKALNV